MSLAKVLPYLIVTVMSVLVTIGYTSDLEMAWLLAFLLVPLWAAAAGVGVGLVFFNKRRDRKRACAALITFSLWVHVGLMVEEAQWGLIRRNFDAYAATLRDAESKKELHEAELDHGRSLFFSDSDSAYLLNFEYQGRRTIEEAELAQLITGRLRGKGVVVKHVAIEPRPPVYRKGVFSIGQPGAVNVEVLLQSPVERGKDRFNRLDFRLEYENNDFRLRETGWGFLPN